MILSLIVNLDDQLDCFGRFVLFLKLSNCRMLSKYGKKNRLLLKKGDVTKTIFYLLPRDIARNYQSSFIIKIIYIFLNDTVTLVHMKMGFRIKVIKRFSSVTSLPPL